MSLIRRILGSSLSLLLLVTALVVGSIFTPNFSVEVGELPSASSQSAKAADLRLVCPGSAYRSGGASGTRLGVFDQVGTAEVNAIVSPKLVETAGAAVQSVALSAQGDSSVLPPASGVPARIARPTAITAVDAGGKLDQGSQLLSVSTLQLQNSKDFSGLLAASCQAPSTDLWFVGGDTSIGREGLLIVTNPSRVDAQIDVIAFNAGGRVKADGLTGLSVPAGKTLVLQLASDLLNQSTLALHLSATGGSVAAWLQQRTMRGTIPGGSDFIGPATELSKSLVIPGLLLRGTADAAAIIKTRPEYGDQTPLLRVFVPAMTATSAANGAGAKAGQTVTVTAQIFGASARTFGTVLRQELTVGTVTDIPITGLADGDYVAFVSAEQPVRASIRLPRTNKTKSPATDFTWLQAGESLQGIRGFRVPQSGVTKLSLGNASKSEARLQLGSPAQIIAGTAPIVTLAAGAVRTIGLTAGALVWMKTESSALRANLVTDLDSTVSSLPITDFKNSAEQLLISVR